MNYAFLSYDVDYVGATENEESLQPLFDVSLTLRKMTAVLLVLNSQRCFMRHR